ncbi:NAD(P)-dependent oxidoreductase [Pullulanibacillus sp. KACC 23026]|uniref:NAD-dependent epimerase/dehydratase family protein n=1 Tax=Pullulanibacillus sp. KACC 23026 TaxID=3028315 RepID=UPI0023AED8BC|nr:NAD(P)-dependent oxidoreductase [Pullulanibacillus sp. KACC 23026]WEG11723.1 NAD(P)-dependent oxidoreductase [Pullulanibacillus sp. KACC 23026]
MKIAVTGGSGRIGHWIIQDLIDHGYDVINLDQKEPEKSLCQTIITNLTDLGQVVGALFEADAIIHMGSIPVAYSHPNEVVFQNNVMTTYNVLEAAYLLGIKKVVMASSECLYGICFSKHKLSPTYVPIDEAHPQLPEDSYGLSKIVNEETAEMMCRRTDRQIIALRITNVITPEIYQQFPNFIYDPSRRENLLWSYIDVRDVASACRLSIEKSYLGFQAVNLAADETCMAIKSSELLATCYPTVTDIREPIDDYQSLLSNKKAKQLLGWEPQCNWREEVNKMKVKPF